MAGQEFTRNRATAILKSCRDFGSAFQVAGQDAVIKSNISLAAFRAYRIEADFKERSIFLYRQAFRDVDIPLYSQLPIAGLRKVKPIVE